MSAKFQSEFDPPALNQNFYSPYLILYEIHVFNLIDGKAVVGVKIALILSGFTSQVGCTDRYRPSPKRT